MLSTYSVAGNDGQRVRDGFAAQNIAAIPRRPSEFTGKPWMQLMLQGDSVLSGVAVAQ